mmetsp:Transcript_18616/g.60563  ORF Transcript_18616/g.60563 Transcript_18616/m.60563 type:complete len:245 (-) Transcript_18616:174-908(-)|eukprot:CAMPEP_0203880988 /NCGR_PEP_ID=MMETSP0359-20131031/25347_1 /ASSEMBLY_ACC=CAM_ASM_000338 /TAXON_ID=268821 /ORGANISM="Scrippsiella Hangoei, Strain SHTV-5" /LENGTH=244 /DNA_ID=CAMNT_0050800729 /DNA_START=50 /DNA_END=784 /DNA_ORIENTATION=-
MANVDREREPDLEVELEGEVVQVCAHVLVFASDVFAKMLESDMSESRSARISLVGKKKTEFEELLKHIDLRGGAELPAINRKNVKMLLQWADEYQITGVRSRCRKYLLDGLKVSVESQRRKESLQRNTGVSAACASLYSASHREKVALTFDLACTFGLHEVRTAAWAQMQVNIQDYASTVAPYINDPTVVASMVPELRKALKLPHEATKDMPNNKSSADMLWPLLAHACALGKKTFGPMQRLYR